MWLRLKDTACRINYFPIKLNIIHMYIFFFLGSCFIRIIFYFIPGKYDYYFNGHSTKTKRSQNKTNYKGKNLIQSYRMLFSM